jgi:hypothetical protein
VIPRAWLGLALLAACTSGGAQVGEGGRGSVAEAWRRGPRDSALAVALACELSRGLRSGPAAQCETIGFREAPGEYVVRIRETGLDFPLSEVRLDKNGTDAGVERLVVP